MIENLWHGPKNAEAQVSVVPWAQSLPGLKDYEKLKVPIEGVVLNHLNADPNWYFTFFKESEKNRLGVPGMYHRKKQASYHRITLY